MQKQTSTPDAAKTKLADSTPHSIVHHTLCALNTAAQLTERLSHQLHHQSSLPFKLLAVSWLLTNVLLPLLLITHPLARSSLLHAFVAVSGSLLLYQLLGDGPFLFTPFLLLLPLLTCRLRSCTWRAVQSYHCHRYSSRVCYQYGVNCSWSSTLSPSQQWYSTSDGR